MHFGCRDEAILNAKFAKFVHAIHVDSTECDSSSMTRRYILEKEIFPVAGNILLSGARQEKYNLV